MGTGETDSWVNVGWGHSTMGDSGEVRDYLISEEAANRYSKELAELRDQVVNRQTSEFNLAEMIAFSMNALEIVYILLRDRSGSTPSFVPFSGPKKEVDS